jgi:hypothetical protein
MAGAGYKLFNTGDVLTAAQVNTYLQEQVVMVFADATARTTALSGVLAEGMVSYLKSTKVVEIYNGTAWASLDDPNAIQNTIVDAKGDLITATGNDVPARLAVGTNDYFLQAASGESTGLKWGGAYTAWTPSFDNFTLGNGTVTARYILIGKHCHAFARVTFGSTSAMSGAGLQITFPVAPAYQPNDPVGIAALNDNGTAVLTASVWAVSTTKIRIQAIRSDGTYVGYGDISSTVPFTWTTGDQFFVNLCYEVA